MSVMTTVSAASGQRCLYCGATYSLYPPVIGGCPACAADDFKAPLELIYDYPEGIEWLAKTPLPGLTRYAPMLPPLVERVSMGEGGTALVPFLAAPEMGNGREIYIKERSVEETQRNIALHVEQYLHDCVHDRELGLLDARLQAVAAEIQSTAYKIEIQQL